ncbi:putative tyrosine-protein phosphatase [Lophiostoma macrostomum CBS 122681]|uniref:Putative tyrosine-protein phosphatase n=1 Tax=Lophiostoma macrostomum CBS 122681 TaxID=1314788 RepID=A0A6A6T3A1_9PLEO|nr:putative tyrosine-protein phosphatase [Lophiostoma macrostomum CBS 122681]
MPPKVSMLADIPGEENIPSRSSPTASTALPLHPTFFPFHIIPGISNFRDVGGWPISGESHVRKGVLYRGSDTNRVTPDGIARLQELHIKTDFDLRSSQQIERTGGYKVLGGMTRIWTPVFADEQYTEEAAKQRYELYAGEGTDGIVTAFIEILTSGTTMFRTVLRHLLATIPPSSDETAPALFMHCTTGNNRTGVFISLLLLLLGVPESVVIEEYALSEKGLAPTRHINVERLLKKGAFKEYGPEEAQRKCERMVGARPESMRALIEEVKRRWGGPEGYFKEHVRLTGEEIARLKTLLNVT